MDRVLADGDFVEGAQVALRAIHTPGHASNHVCFLLTGNGMLFTGDHIMQGSTVVIWPPDGNTARPTSDRCGTCWEFELAVLAPGHGHLIDQPRAELNRLIRHRLRREDKVRQAVLRGRHWCYGRDAFAVSLWTTCRSLFTNGPHCRSRRTWTNSSKMARSTARTGVIPQLPD